MTMITRVRNAASGLLFGFAATLSLAWIGYQVAYAQSIPSPPVFDTKAPGPAITSATDPMMQPMESMSFIEQLWRSGAVTSAGIVLAFFVLVILRAHVKWLAVGYRSVLVSAAIAGLGFLVDGISNGVTPNTSMIVVALSTAIALALQTVKKSEAS